MRHTSPHRNQELDVLTYFPLCPPAVPPHHEQALTILSNGLPQCDDIEVIRFELIDRPDLSHAMWQSLKQRFTRQGRTERAFQAQMVLNAIRTTYPGSLAVVKARAEEVTFVAWMDLGRATIVAVLEDDMAYIPAA